METESKWKDVRKGEMVKRLRRLGAWKEFDGLVCDTFYDTLDSRLDSHHEILRFRTMKERDCEPVYLVTHKGAFCGSAMFKCRPERECGYDEQQIRLFQYALERAGLRPVRKREKKRVSYRWELMSLDRRDFVSVMIDRYPRLKPILEIEGEKPAIVLAAERLGLSMADALGDDWRMAFPGYDFGDCTFSVK